jgi:hypothetical protein
MILPIRRYHLHKVFTDSGTATVSSCINCCESRSNDRFNSCCWNYRDRSWSDVWWYSRSDYYRRWVKRIDSDSLTERNLINNYRDC